MVESINLQLAILKHQSEIETLRDLPTKYRTKSRVDEVLNRSDTLLSQVIQLISQNDEAKYHRAKSENDHVIARHDEIKPTGWRKLFMKRVRN